MKKVIIYAVIVVIAALIGFYALYTPKPFVDQSDGKPLASNTIATSNTAA